MGTTIQFENPPGTVLATRQFTPGQALRVGGHSTTDFGLPNANGAVSLDITSPAFSPITVQSRVDWLGDFWFDITLPNVNAQAKVEVVVQYSLGSPEVVTVPIGIGSAVPAPLPEPEESELSKTIRYAAIGAGILGALYVVSMVAPAFKRGGK